MNLDDLIPISRLPRTGHPPGQEVKWLFPNEREDYRRRGGHPLYGENDITYRLNSLGYRCPEFDAVADIRIVAIGCSYVLGTALPQRAIFHEVFAERLRTAVSPKSVVLWNLGSAGTSNDYISRLLFLAVPLLKPDIVLVNFTHFSRREYISIQNRIVKIGAWNPADAVTKDIFSHFEALSSPLDDQLNFFRNYKGVECALARSQWLYSFVRRHEFEAVASHTDLNHFVGHLQVVDRARDHTHPGPESHRSLAELYWRKFNELGGLRALEGKPLTK
jgi:hypothetical protein